jgi:hypothetical protein
MPEKKTPIEIKHYKRVSANSKNKELITEKVHVGSATFKFLERMESRRRKQECLLTLDMRGKVPEECKKYIHKNKTFWMDDASYKIFVEGLKRDNLVFTVGTFEDIIEGDHTYKGMRRAGKQVDISAGNSIAGKIHQKEESKKNIYQPDADQPEIIPLGYYRNRKEERLQYSTSVKIRIGKLSVDLKTRDISAHGMQLSSEQYIPLEVGAVVRVTFVDLNSEFNADLHDIVYEVLSVRLTEQGNRFALTQQDKRENKASRFLDTFINDLLNSTKGKRRLCHEDSRLTAYSQLIELYYTLSTPIIPFFVQQDGDSQGISVICKNPNNAYLLSLFKDKRRIYDFSSLVDEGRMKNMIALAREDGQKDPIIAIYRNSDSNGPKVVGDFEFPLEASWLSFVRDHFNDEDFSIYKVLLRPSINPDPVKLSGKIKKLKKKSEEHAHDVMVSINRVVASGAFVDVTQQIIKQAKSVSFMLDDDSIKAGRHIVESQVENDVNMAPDIFSFGYVEQRKEDRYQVQVSAEVVAGDMHLTATTRDISVYGLCIEFDGDVKGLLEKSKVGICLPGLQKRAKLGSRLGDIPYEITCIEKNDKMLFHMKRIMDQNSKDCTLFFKDLIARNIEKLKLDMQDMMTAAYSRLYSALAVESPATIPILIKKDESRKNHVSVALPEEKCTFVEFFEVKPGEYDFSFINVSTRLSRLVAGIKKGQSSEIIIYLYKKLNESTGEFELFSAADYEFEDQTEKRNFLNEALASDYCILKVLAGKLQQPQEVEINAIIDPLTDRSPHLSKRLKTEVSTFVAIGEVVDITRQVIESENLD